MKNNFRSLTAEYLSKVTEIKTAMGYNIEWGIDPSIYKLNEIHEFIKSKDSEIRAETSLNLAHNLSIHIY